MDITRYELPVSEFSISLIGMVLCTVTKGLATAKVPAEGVARTLPSGLNPILETDGSPPILKLYLFVEGSCCMSMTPVFPFISTSEDLLLLNTVANSLTCQHIDRTNCVS
jgi:hypothetical protein